MARFSGFIGYANQVEKSLDVWDDDITEKRYYGEIKKDAKRWFIGSEITSPMKLTSKISVVADAYANDNFDKIRYVVISKKRFEVVTVDIEHPRLVLTLGGVYNGPIPNTP
jgi:hypothetical protein